MMSRFLLLVLIWHLLSTVGLTLEPSDLLQLSLEGEVTLDPRDTAAASTDFGGTTRSDPLAVLRPLSTNDVAAVVRAAYDSPTPFPVSARGHGHSIHGQAGAAGGVVVEMSHHGIARTKAGRRSRPVLSTARLGGVGYHVDVWGGELWINVLRWTLENGGLAPRSWTDYLHLSVGGTLSNAGISGQAFRHGPQISNVLELDVVTGKGEVVTCSEEQNQDLFHAVLGGLGQFGIITRARIALEPAPKRTRWIRMLYSNFTAFTEDQERLISLDADDAAAARLDYVEGFVIVDEGLPGNWRSSFFSPANNNGNGTAGGNNINTNNAVNSSADVGTFLYCLEVAKNYDDSAADSAHEQVEVLMDELSFIPGTVFATDVAYVDFLDRVHAAELKLRPMGLWEVPHPWLNLFVPASKMAQFDRAVFRPFLRKPGGPILVYPTNRSKWDERSSVVVPDEEEVFYLVAFLRSAIEGAGDDARALEYLTEQNDDITRFCHDAGIGCKQYLPHHTGGEEWRQHFGNKWETFLRRKAEFDPRRILGTGQGIFRAIDSFPVRSS